MRTKLECGREYNDWTVLAFDRVDEKRAVRYICRCRCGFETSLKASAVVAGRTKRCVHCRALKLTGQKINDWLVLEAAGSDKSNKTLWRCRCKCGKEEIVLGSNLVSHKSKCCFDCGHKMSMRSKTIPTIWWYKTIRQAECRGWKWEVTEEEAHEILERQGFCCALSGLPLLFKPQTASLDRIDSTKHYFPENIQWVHKHINMMKFRYAQDYFIEMCSLVAKNSRRSNDSNQHSS